MQNTNIQAFAKKLEHSVLSPAATERDIIDGCAVARQYGAGVMMVQPFWLNLAAEALSGSDVIPASVLAFPHGCTLAAAKAFEAESLVRTGTREIDMVMNIGAFKSGLYRAVEDDIAGVVKASQPSVVKVILEICYLSDDEIVTACKICENAGAGFVKTSTGFGKSGATKEAVALMRNTVGNRMGVKASGGIRTLADAQGMIESGAGRIGTSSTVQIMEELMRSLA